MTTTLSAPVPIVGPTGRADTCRTCPLPFPDWDTTHPLFRPWSTDCPACIQDAITEDHHLARLEDR